MVAYTTRMGAGFAGAIARSDSLTVQPELIDSATPPTAYGIFVKLVSGKVQSIGAGDQASAIYGVLTRPFPAQSATNALGAAAPPASGVCDVLKRGYVSVVLAAGAATKGGQVYVRITAGSGRAAGAIEAGADGGNCIAVPGAVFMGAADANGVVEIAYNI